MNRTPVDVPTHFMQFSSQAKFNFTLRPEIRDWLVQRRIKHHVFVTRNRIYFDTLGDAVFFKLQMPEWDERFKPKFTIEKMTIQAKSRRLTATWTLEQPTEYLPMRYGNIFGDDDES